MGFCAYSRKQNDKKIPPENLSIEHRKTCSLILPFRPCEGGKKEQSLILPLLKVMVLDNRRIQT